ncbi:hypothetical protein HN51_040845, partial [Arachis hypogaea]
MDKGTSESSLLGTGSPLPSIPLHSIVSYCTIPDQIHLLSERKGVQLLEHGRMKSNDFSKSSRTDYYSESTFPSEHLGSPVNPHDV